MKKQQLYARGEPFCPEVDAEYINALDIYGITGHQEDTLQAILDKIADMVANKLLEKAEIADWAKQETKPSYTAGEVGADEYGSAQTALDEAKEYADRTYQQATGYTDTKIAGLINSAQGTLETLDKISDAMANNKEVVDALEAAIGCKASDVELQAHISNETVHITERERGAWNAGKQKLEGIEEGATRVTLTKSLMATAEGTGLDAVVGPTLVGMINSLRDNLTNMINEINGNMSLMAQHTHGKNMRCFCYVPQGANNIYWIAFNIPTGVSSLTLRSMDITGSHNTTNFTVRETYIYGLSAAVLLYTTENIGNRMVSFDALIG